MLKQINPVNH